MSEKPNIITIKEKVYIEEIGDLNGPSNNKQIKEPNQPNKKSKYYANNNFEYSNNALNSYDNDIEYNKQTSNAKNNFIYNENKNYISDDNHNDNNINSLDKIESVEEVEVTRKPSNLDRRAKLEYQAQILQKKREREKANQIIQGANNIPRNYKYYSNDNQGYHGIYSTQPDEADTEDKYKKINQDKQPKSSNSTRVVKSKRLYKSGEELDVVKPNSLANKNFSNENLSNGIKLMSVTDDATKDYTSSDDDDADFPFPTESPFASNSNNENSNHVSKSEIKKMFNKDGDEHSPDDEETPPNEKSTNNNTIMMVAPISQDSNDDDTLTTSSTSGNKKKSGEKNATEGLDLSMFDLIDKTSKKFILKPATMGLTIRAQIFRQKGLYPQYRFYLENLDGQLLLLMTARKKKKTKTTHYVINYITFNAADINKYIETPIAKLKSNLLGTQFTLYDFGLKNFNAQTNGNGNSNNFINTFDNEADNSMNESKQPTQNSDNNNNNNGVVDTQLNRKEYASVTYVFNVLGIKGPRSMSVVIPGMDNSYNREDYTLKGENDSLLGAWKKIETTIKKSGDQVQMRQKSATLSKLVTLRRSLFQAGPGYYSRKSKPPQDFDNVETINEPSANKANEKLSDKIEDNVVKLVNKSPSWHPELRSFALNFNGRVTQASVKNFQIVHEVNTDYVVMQFGKVNKDMYTCDYSYPMCALQAFGIALTSLDNKLGCD